MKDLPKLIEISRTEGIHIDGEEFQFPVAADSVIVNLNAGGVPAVSLTLLAEHVILDHQGVMCVPEDKS